MPSLNDTATTEQLSLDLDGATYDRKRDGERLGGKPKRNGRWFKTYIKNCQRICSVDGCERNVLASGLCKRHYDRKYLYGDPTAPPPIYKTYGMRKAFIEHALSYKGDDCLIWPFTRNTNGYPQMTLNAKTANAHRVVCEGAHGPPPFKKAQAAHSCGNGHLGCVNPKHLRWATPKENSADAVRMGRTLKGERNPASKLTVENVICIKKLQGTRSPNKVAEEFGVSRITVYRIWKGIIWTWVVP